ncbi:MAG: S8 family serine peptidase, partial [Saprospiraceae bacterium]|nr:S8 family serine peptidase [Saprospiraceae bacterium]
MVSKLISTVLLLSFVFGISVFGQDSSGVGTEGTVIDLDLSLIGINRIHQAYPWLDGSGIRVSIQEEAFDTMDADLLGRYLDVGLTSRVSAKHATNMATVIAGAGNTSIRGLGVAYGALISSSNLMGRIPDPLNVYRQNDIFLQNHSYGDTNAVSYNHQSIAFDQSMFEESRLLHVFSSGNNGVGNGETSLGQINGGANLTGSMKQAKNPIIIGAIDTIERIQLFSSRGPTLDGRIKPDLVTFALFGSSNAAALTSGVCALLQHAYLDQYGTYPSAALLKAALIQSAKDIDEPGPDYQSGFGSLDAFAAVQVIMEERFKESSLTGKDTYTENWLVPESTEQIRIALAWIDPPASDEMEKLLVHDLDLQVVTPVGDTLRPWTIPFTNISDLTARRGRDSLNNVEVFTLQNAEAGIYQLLVSANLPAGATQGFSLAYGSQAPDRFHWLYPLATDPVPFNGEAFTYVQWDTDFTGVGILEA